MQGNEEILSPDKQLRAIKLEAYFELLREFAKYRKLVVYRGVAYPKIKWIDALISFYDMMFNEANDEEYKNKYKDLFDALQKLNHTKDISYDDLLKHTKEIMSFANDTGITKISKHKKDDRPGGAEYEKGY